MSFNRIESEKLSDSFVSKKSCWLWRTPSPASHWRWICCQHWVMALTSMGILLGMCTDTTNLRPIRHSGSLLFPSQFFKHVEGQYYEKFYHLVVMLFINWFFSRLVGKLSHYLFLRNSSPHCYVYGTPVKYFCVPRNTSAHKLVTALKMLLIVFLNLRPEQLWALSHLYPEWSPGLCSSSFRPCERSEQIGPSSQASPQP